LVTEDSDLHHVYRALGSQISGFSEALSTKGVNHTRRRGSRSYPNYPKAFWATKSVSHLL
jgi:hypothetical protein